MIAQASTSGIQAFAKAVIASVTAAAAARIDRIAGSAFMFVSSLFQGFLLCSEFGSSPSRLFELLGEIETDLARNALAKLPLASPCDKLTHD
jgi:hypothetical protein